MDPSTPAPVLVLCLGTFPGRDGACYRETVTRGWATFKLLPPNARALGNSPNDYPSGETTKKAAFEEDWTAERTRPTPSVQHLLQIA